MSLLFGGATSDRVDVATDARLTGLSQLTVCGWFYPTTLTNGRMLAQKDQNSGARAWSLSLDGTGGNVQFIVNGYLNNGPTSHIHLTSDVPLATLNAWHFVAATVDWGVSGAIYSGLLTGTITARALASNQVSADAQASDTGGPMFIGNRTAYDRSFQGRIGGFTVIPAVLTLGQIRTLAADPRPWGGAPYYELGQSGTGTQPDLSGGGAAGTPTGLSLAPFVPIGRRRLTTQALQRAATW